MRLFLGIELDDAMRAAAAAVVDALRERLRQSVPDLDARWVPSENLHVTVWFIGEVNEARADAVQQAMQAPLAARAFMMSTSGCGAFPRSGPPRVFWLGVGEGTEGAIGVYGEIAERMTPLGFEAERRGYTPHITIARVKEAPRARTRSIREALLAARAGSDRSRVTAVTLFRSRLSPRGASYEPLLRVPLS